MARSAETCRKTSLLPSSGTMKPKPLLSLKNLTVPCICNTPVIEHGVASMTGLPQGSSPQSIDSGGLLFRRFRCVLTNSLFSFLGKSAPFALAGINLSLHGHIADLV